MGSAYPAIDEKLAEFIESQQLFFVATAPLSAEGHVNLSPKGLEAFRILDPTTVAYLDMTGSGIETLAHLRENGRICFMFCSFTEAPKIVRLHGTGEAFERSDPEFERLAPLFPDLVGARSIIKVSLTRIADSCGYGVPMYEFKSQRKTLIKFSENLGEEKIRSVQVMHNARSLDGLEGLRFDAAKT